MQRAHEQASCQRRAPITWTHATTSPVTGLLKGSRTRWELRWKSERARDDRASEEPPGLYLDELRHFRRTRRLGDRTARPERTARRLRGRARDLARETDPVGPVELGIGERNGREKRLRVRV